ncbi:unnamed protein product [Owenia fusiformis]|uniref:Uncharacterized protein n=1 Tax=Owenia fusiformis TaxID=6347 RepID=A0A8J1UW52_OWEFU|nr:unnamed protein product [Owenia fusiformis]
MVLIDLAGLVILLLSVHVARSDQSVEDYTGPCLGGYTTYSRTECADSYQELRRENAYTGLSMQQYTWQCDHMYQWLSSAANKTGRGSKFTENQKNWLKGLIEEVIRAIRPPTKRSSPVLPHRKEYRVATDAERNAFHQAINLLKASGDYDTLVSFHHGSVALGAHGGAAFLPWHRIYLLMYEIALRQKKPGVSLLYWDSTIEQGIPMPHLSSLWSPAFVGNGDGDVTEGPFANWMATDGTKLRRVVQHYPNQLTTPADIMTVLSKSRYDEIACGSTACRLLENIHGKAHSYVGGHLGDIHHSPNDPLFFMHHAFIDCIWEEFRENSQVTPLATEYPSNFGQPPHHPQAYMQPFSNWVSPIRNIEGLSTLITSNNYKCDKRPTCPNCGKSAHLYCDKSDNRCKPFIKSGDCGEGTVFIPAVIYCDQAVYGNPDYGVNGVYLETYGVSYKGRDQAYYFGDYYSHYNTQRSSNPRNYRPTYAGYFPTRRPKARGRERYQPSAYTANGRRCTIECFQGYKGGQPTYGQCPTAIYNVYQAPYVDDADSIYTRPEQSYRAPTRPRLPELYKVTCPCEYQRYTYCPTYIPPGKGCRWTNWSPWRETRCSVTCGAGIKGRLRTRSKQYISGYTGSCVGPSQETSTAGCDNPPCFRGCRWKSWDQWKFTKCSVSCGVGIRSRSRTRGKEYSFRYTGTCTGNSREAYTERCVNPPCKPGCKWDPWDQWTYTQCSVSCGVGVRSRSHTRNKRFSYGYTGNCTGNSQEMFTEKCENPPCPPGCKWRSWSPWILTKCSVSCGSGKRRRTRTRSKQFIIGYTGSCTGNSQESFTLSCDNPPCQKGCRWSSWSPWRSGKCSVTCGSGTKSRSRTRTKQFINGYRGTCTGNSKQSSTERCVKSPCEDECDDVLCPMVRCSYGFVTKDCCQVCEPNPCENIRCQTCLFGVISRDILPGECCPRCKKSPFSFS